MPEITATKTAADMTCARPHTLMPGGGQNRRAARAQAAALRWLVRIAAFLTAAVLVFLIGYILVMGIPNLKPELFAWEYNSENVSLTPALINTVLMTAFALLIATPLGIFAAIWLVEYARRGSKLVKVVRVTTETLQGIPSIVYGLFGMLFFVTQLHWGYSLIAGAFTLAIMVLPVIMRTTEEALIAVPDSYREGSFGLGAGKLRTVFTIVLPSAMPGILSGVILATGRIVGETAALIYTASSVAKIPTSVFSSTRTLAVHMYLLSNEGLYIGQTYGTAVVLLVLVLVINCLSGFLAGLGGAFVTLATINQFRPSVIVGQGFIAIAAVIFGKFSPGGSMLACLLFGFCSGIKSLAGQSNMISPNLISMIPYVVTLLALILFVGKAHTPAANGKIFIKSK